MKRARMALFAGLVVFALIAAIAWSRGPESAERYRSVDALAEEMSAAGIPCRSLQRGFSGSLPSSGAFCVLNGGSVGLYLFDDRDAKEQWLEVAARLGKIAVGPNWAVTGPEDVVTRVAAELGGVVAARG